MDTSPNFNQLSPTSFDNQVIASSQQRFTSPSTFSPTQTNGVSSTQKLWNEPPTVGKQDAANFLDKPNRRPSLPKNFIFTPNEETQHLSLNTFSCGQTKDLNSDQAVRMDQFNTYFNEDTGVSAFEFESAVKKPNHSLINPFIGTEINLKRQNRKPSIEETFSKGINPMGSNLVSLQTSQDQGQTGRSIVQNLKEMEQMIGNPNVFSDHRRGDSSITQTHTEVDKNRRRLKVENDNLREVISFKDAYTKEQGKTIEELENERDSLLIEYDEKEIMILQLECTVKRLQEQRYNYLIKYENARSATQRASEPVVSIQDSIQKNVEGIQVALKSLGKPNHLLLTSLATEQSLTIEAMIQKLVAFETNQNSSAASFKYVNKSPPSKISNRYVENQEEDSFEDNSNLNQKDVTKKLENEQQEEASQASDKSRIRMITKKAAGFKQKPRGGSGGRDSFLRIGMDTTAATNKTIRANPISRVEQKNIALLKQEKEERIRKRKNSVQSVNFISARNSIKGTRPNGASSIFNQSSISRTNRQNMTSLLVSKELDYQLQDIDNKFIEGEQSTVIYQQQSKMQQLQLQIKNYLKQIVDLKETNRIQSLQYERIVVAHKNVSNDHNLMLTKCANMKTLLDRRPNQEDPLEKRNRVLRIMENLKNNPLDEINGTIQNETVPKLIQILRKLSLNDLARLEFKLQQRSQTQEIIGLKDKNELLALEIQGLREKLDSSKGEVQRLKEAENSLFRIKMRTSVQVGVMTVILFIMCLFFTCKQLKC